ncbi:hypothetical protein H6F77_10365 [Microcoleus sp. FACHB-831]|uniref:hypothetical protein n=1 Tax=Microcoleus sp. FACHB-831 TaxID=2692827 RepID=UPI001682AE19|nr:hypothetical protein [Microcoleus sp. FACHB-831]MBD1921494.1 hypothetical protein [Microcoleus sp. FACHB-831]
MPTLYHQNHQPLLTAIAPHRDWRFWILDFAQAEFLRSDDFGLEKVFLSPWGDAINRRL